MFFWNFLAFSMIQWMLAIWSLVPLPFLKPAYTSGGREHMHCYKAGQGIEPPGDSSLWVLLGKIEGAWSRGEEKLAPLWRGQGECWHLNSDGRVPAGNKRELNLKMRCGQAKNGSAGGWWPTSRENWWREFHSLSNLPRVGWALLKVLSLPYV